MSFQRKHVLACACFAAGSAAIYSSRSLLPTRNPSIGSIAPIPTNLEKNISFLPKKLEHNDLEKVTEWANLPNSRGELERPNMHNHPNVLYQMATCPFCSKVRTFLRANHIPFDIVEVDPVGMKGVKHPTYKKVPQFQVGGKEAEGPLLLDSSEIVSVLAAPFGEAIPRPIDTEHWRTWANNVLSRYIAIEIGTNFRSSCAFIASHPDLSAGRKMKYLGAGLVMFFAAHKVVAPKLNALGYDTTDTRVALQKELLKWGDRLVSSPENILHGEVKPSLADTDVFGVLHSIRGHKIYADIFNFSKSNSAALYKWLQVMEAQTLQHV